MHGKLLSCRAENEAVTHPAEQRSAMEKSRVEVRHVNRVIFPAYSCLPAAVPQQSSFMVHPAMRHLRYARSGETPLPFWPFFNNSDHPVWQDCNWPWCSPRPTSVSMVTSDRLPSPRGGVQPADEFGCCTQSKDQPTQTSEYHCSLS